MTSDSSARLAGFALAHAAWCVSDMAEGGALTPFLLAEDAGARELMRFEAASQTEAVEEGKRAAARLASRVDAWAFARDGLLRMHGSDGAEHVLVVEFAWRGEAAVYTAVQPYQPAAVAGGFRLRGEPMILINGEVLDTPEARLLRQGIDDGTRGHPGVAGTWDAWREPAVPDR